MKPKGDFFWRFDTALFNWVGAACLLAGIYCIGWAALIVFVKFGDGSWPANGSRPRSSPCS